jgi:methylmalonyl-CoA mutase N-terminal domain/subunit
MSTEDQTKSFYTAADLPEWARDGELPAPGEFPFLRGIHPEMYRERLWRMRQYAGFGTAKEANERWKALIASGQHGISCAFDLPTQLGLDSDDPVAAEDAGRLGVAVDTLDDFIALFDGIPLDQTATTFNINASAPVIYAMLLEAADHQGVPADRLTGTLSNDPLIEFIARGLWSLPPEGALRLMGDAFAHSLQVSPSFYPMNLRATLVYEAGGSVAHEFGFGMACAQGYMDELAGRGLDMGAVASRLSFLLFSDSNFLEEACAFRAARKLWAEMIEQRYGVTNRSAQKLRFSVAVGNFNLRAQLPELNLVRNTLGALGGILGGCQAMLVAGMDEAFAIPSEYSSLLGLYTQQVIAYESKLTDVVDPLGGSYYVEATTDKLLRAMREVMNRVEEEGGILAAIEAGMPQREINDAAYRYQLEEEEGKRLVVGVNTPGSPPPEDPSFELHEHDDSAMVAKRKALAAHRAQRDAAAWEAGMGEVERTLDSSDDLIPAMRAALRAGATIGEIMHACTARYGAYHERGAVV